MDLGVNLPVAGNREDKTFRIRERDAVFIAQVRLFRKNGADREFNPAESERFFQFINPCLLFCFGSHCYLSYPYAQCSAKFVFTTFKTRKRPHMVSVSRAFCEVLIIS